MENISQYKNSDVLTQWIKGLLCLQVIILVIAVISNYFEYQLLSDLKNYTYTSEEEIISRAEASDTRQILIGAISFVSYLITVILSLIWIYRANHNARQLGAKDMKFTPGWAIGYYIIPILSLWKPYQAMEEIWKASKDPENWQTQSANKILPIWWTFWISSNILGQIVLRLSLRAEYVDELTSLNIVTQLSDIVDISLTIVFFILVSQIHQMQKNHSEKMNHRVQSVV